MNCLLKSKVIWRHCFKDDSSHETEYQKLIWYWGKERQQVAKHLPSTAPSAEGGPRVQSKHFGSTKMLSRQLKNLLHFSPVVQLLQAVRCNREFVCAIAKFQSKVLLNNVSDQMAGIRNNVQFCSISHFHVDECSDLWIACRILRFSYLYKTGELWSSTWGISLFEGPLTQHHSN